MSEFQWKETRVFLLGKEITGIREVIVEPGLAVNECGEIEDILKMYNAETNEEIK